MENHDLPFRPFLGPFIETDFILLPEHPLAWRWTDPKWNQLPAAALAQIRPLSELNSQKVRKSILHLIGTEVPRLDECFDRVDQIDTSRDPEEVRDWLAGRIPPNSGQLVLLWCHDAALPALVTAADVFSHYWDDFCYPSSDDVIAWSLNDGWAAFYHHSELLYFGRKAR